MVNTLLNPAPVFDFNYWNDKLFELNKKYNSAEPFPHIVIDNFLSAEELEKVLHEFENFEATDWVNYAHINERKKGFNRMEALPPLTKSVVKELNSASMLEFVTGMTGIKGLLPDDSLEGGGLHQSTTGGFLNIHADFVSHPHNSHWRRRVNLLVYLNKDWKEDWGGYLELWDRDMTKCVHKIAPVFNRCVIFNTDPTSYHGHPEPMTCPSGVKRRSLALYYFTDEVVPLKVRSTNYKARPQDANRKWLISLDNFMVNFYTTIKRRTGLNDKFVSKILGFFTSKK